MNTPTSVQGRCFCGAIQFELSFPTDFCSHCHCEDCRRSHSAAFVTWASVPIQQFHWISGAAKLRKYQSHPGVCWGFCGECGTSLLYDSDDAPMKIYVTVASLTGPIDREPEGHVSFEEHVPWLRVDDRLPKFRGKTAEEIK